MGLRQIEERRSLRDGRLSPAKPTSGGLEQQFYGALVLPRMTNCGGEMKL